MQGRRARSRQRKIPRLLARVSAVFAAEQVDGYKSPRKRYIKNWLKVSSADRKVIVTAASPLASKAVEYLRGLAVQKPDFIGPPC